jgi:hypothetical protein
MKNILLVSVFFFSGVHFIAFGQQANPQIDTDQLEVSFDVDQSSGEDIVSKQKKIDTGIEVGTSFNYSPHNYYGSSFYIAPNLTYKLNSRLILQTGIMIEKSMFYPLYKQGELSNDILPMTRTFLFAKGNYLLTPRLTVSGTAYKSFNDVPKLTSSSAPYNYNLQGVCVDFQYKISRSISVGFHVLMQNGYYNRQISPADYNPVSGFDY